MELRLLGLRVSNIEECKDSLHLFKAEKIEKSSDSVNCPVCLQLLPVDKAKQAEHIDYCLAVQIANNQSSQESNVKKRCTAIEKEQTALDKFLNKSK